jgi:hypothetical protein
MDTNCGGTNWLAVVLVSATVSAVVAELSAMLHELWKEHREKTRRKHQIEAEARDAEEARTLSLKLTEIEHVNPKAIELRLRKEARLKYGGMCYGLLHDTFDPPSC